MNDKTKVLVNQSVEMFAGMAGYIQRWYDDETAILVVHTPKGDSQGWAFHTSEFTYV